MNKYFIVFLCVFMVGCESFGRKPIEVKIPVPTVSTIEQLPPFESETDKLSEADRQDYKKVAESYKKDVEILKKRDEIHQKLIEQHNGDN